MNEVMPVVDRSVDWAACGDSISRNLNPNYGTDRSDQKFFCQRNIAESFSDGRKKTTSRTGATKKVQLRKVRTVNIEKVE